MSTMRTQQVALRRHISIAQKQTFTPEDQLNPTGAAQEHHSFLKHQHGEYGLPYSRHYHQIYAQDIQDSISRNQEESILPRSSKVIVYRDILNYNQSNMDQQGGNQARVQRSVTFDLSMERALFVSSKEGPYKISKTKWSKTLERSSKPGQGKVSAKGDKKRHLKIHEQGSPRKSKLKVKLNLNPLRKSQVQPKSGSNQEDKDVKKTSKKIKKDKSQKSKVKKNNEQQESKEKSKKGKITEKLQVDESSTNPGEAQSFGNNPKESESLIEPSNLLAENIEPLGTANTTDPQVPTLDLTLALMTPDDSRDLQKPPQDIEDPPNDPLTTVSTTVSVVQEYLSSGDGSPKRKIRLIVPEKPSSRPQTALEKKIR